MWGERTRCAILFGLLTAAPSPAFRSTFFGLLLLSAGALLLELALTRVLSVALWYHFAFMAVSSALFGFGLAGVALSLRRSTQAPSARTIAVSATATPLGVAAGFWLYNLIPFEPFSLGSDPLQWLWFPLALTALAVPFFAAGLCVAATLSRHAHAVHRLYLFDLVGAGLGGLLTVLCIPALGGSGAVLAAAALTAAGAALLSREASARFTVANGVVAAALVAALPAAETLLPMRVSRDKVIRGGQFGLAVKDPKFHLETRWTADARIDVFQLGRGIRHATIDGGAATLRLASPGLLEVLGERHEEEFFYRLTPGARALIVGSAGGRELLIGLRAGAAQLVGVEVISALNDLLRTTQADFSQRIAFDPRVKLYTDEARSFLERDPTRYHLIHCPHTISNASLASGSLTLAESYLMTREAFEAYFQHLEPGGVLLITRPEAHLPRLFATLHAVSGTDDLPKRVMAWRAPADGLSFEAGVAVRTTPFTGEEVEAFAAELSKQHLDALYLPGLTGPYRDLLTRGEAVLPFPALLFPATDDRPFFNQRVTLAQLSFADLASVFTAGKKSRTALEDRPVAEAAVLVLLLQATLLGLVAIVVPLLVFRRRALAAKGRGRSLLTFAALGLGYIVLELSFVQRLTLFLGRPVVVLATVLPALLVASGLGSGLAQRFKARAGAGAAACAAAGGAALLSAVLAYAAGHLALAAPEGVRVALAVLVLAPAGLAMGMPFPLLVSQLEATYPERIPWAWGINGFTSVVGSVLAIVVGMAAGYTAVLALGVAAYAVAALAARASRP